MMKYAGIGSSETPADVCERMREIGYDRAKRGWLLRSGGADGADLAFETGAARHPDAKMEIFLPWCKFNGNSSPLYTVCQKALELAEKYHPAWQNCGRGARLLLARDMYQVLGQTLNDPVDEVLFWTPDKKGKTGGTAQAIRLARALSIPCYFIG